MVYLTQESTERSEYGHSSWDAATDTLDQAARAEVTRAELYGKRYEEVVDLLIAAQQALFESGQRERALEHDLRQTERALHDRTEATHELRRAVADAQLAQRDADARAGAASDEVTSLQQQVEDLTHRTGLWTKCLACGHHIGEPLDIDLGLPVKKPPPMTDAERERLARKAEKERMIQQLVSPQDRSSPWLDWL